MARLVNFVGFQIAWFACVAGAGQGWPMLGPLVTAVLVGLHLGVTCDRGREALLLAIVGLLGSAVDSGLSALGLYTFTGPPAIGASCPLWITALWVAFGATLRSSMAWLATHRALAAALGAAAGPLAYWGGVRLGAVHIGAEPWAAYAALAVAWGAAMPGLLSLAQRVGSSRGRNS